MVLFVSSMGLLVHVQTGIITTNVCYLSNTEKSEYHKYACSPADCLLLLQALLPHYYRDARCPFNHRCFYGGIAMSH